MSRIRYQHYVPRFYLEGFQSRTGKLWCYDKKLDKAYQQSPDRLGGESLFYDVPDVDETAGVSQFLEKWFNPLEGTASAALRNWRDRLSSKHAFSPTTEEMWTIAAFMVVQMLRTPRGRRLAVDSAVLAAQISFYNFLGKKNPELAARIGNPLEELHISLEKDRWAYAHVHQLLDIDLHEELAEILMSHIWIVTQNDSRWPYHTSDHPVIKVPHAQHPWKRMTGLRSPGIQLLYPLTPKFSLSLLEKTFWKQHLPHHRRLVGMPALKAHMDFDNSAQVSHAARFVYSRDGDFALAKDMCRETPELRNPDRPELASQRGDQLMVKLDETK
jgi:hypothetical protein